MITVDYKVRLGQVKSEFDGKSPKLTRSVRASKLSEFSVKSHSVARYERTFVRHAVGMDEEWAYGSLCYSLDPLSLIRNSECPSNLELWAYQIAK